MQTEFKRPLLADLQNQLKKYPQFIHVLLGPRQVGKTTAVHQLIKTLKAESALYFSADGDLMKPADWLFGKWIEAKQTRGVELLVIDEIQKIENWSSVAKKIWDEQKQSSKKPLKLLVLGSSSLEIQKGLSESLTGRFLQLNASHWTFSESKRAFSLDLEQYLTFGGYPGSYALIKDRQDWLRYVNDSIIQTVLGKDILSLNRVKSPALFRQCFEILCSYAAQEISYTKLLGQLQDKGNTELIKYYIELFEGAFLLKALPKYSNKKVLVKASSPKILPLCPALYTVTKGADLTSEDFGHAFEACVGSHLAQKNGQLHYWRDGKYEVDFVFFSGKRPLAIEVKYNTDSNAKGLLEFKKQFPKCETLLINPNNFESLLAEI
jgi:uncharacterized protein